MSTPSTLPRRHTGHRCTGPRQALGLESSWPLFGTSGSRQIEARALASAPGATLMPQAGASVARWALALHPHARRISLFCGPGGNGGDGLHAAIVLKQQGASVDTFVCGDLDRLGPHTLAALRAARDAGVRIETDRLPDGANTADLNIDALIGLGRARPEGRVAEAVVRLCNAAVPCLAVDLPTGLDADTGGIWNAPAVRAQATLSLLTLKPGLFTAQGRDHSGQVWLDDLTQGEPRKPVGAEQAPDAWLAGVPQLPALGLERGHAHHKGSFGDVYVIGGAEGMGGALRLAASAALAAGAGRVIAVPLDRQMPMSDPARPELIWRDVREIADHPQSLAKATVVCGCGAGTEAARVLPWVLSCSNRAVLDADALNQVARDSDLANMLAARASRGLATILTPHPLEAARMLGANAAQVQADRLAAAQRLCASTGAVVVLKGSGTVTAGAGLSAVINPTGSAALATPGSGDVLAGWMGGWWSQAASVRRADHDTASALAHRVACASVWTHGRAAEMDEGWVIELARNEGQHSVQRGFASPLHHLEAPASNTQALRASELIERMRWVERGLRRDLR